VTSAGLVAERNVEVEAGETAVTARYDAELLTRDVANLVGNALKFTPEEGAVTVRARSDGTGARVEVQDAGPGIPEEYRTRIFEKFGRVAARGEKRTLSTGLGLTFCKLAVEAHGCEIGVDSVLGQGSTFWFRLP